MAIKRLMTMTPYSIKVIICFSLTMILCVCFLRMVVHGHTRTTLYFISGKNVARMTEPGKNEVFGNGVHNKNEQQPPLSQIAYNITRDEDEHMEMRGGNAKNVFICNEKVMFKDIGALRSSKRLNSARSVVGGDTCVRRLPQCVILGVRKAGTRELIDFMRLHPDIVIKTDPYELGFFLDDQYKRNGGSLDWYRRQMPCTHGNQLTVVKHPYYFTNLRVARRIHAFNKTLKMIVIVREPISRLISGLTFTATKPKFKSSSLGHTLSIDAMVTDVNGSVYTDNSEVILSTYDVALTQYLNYFNLNQFLFIEAGGFKENPAHVLTKVETFLGLEHLVKPSDFVYNDEKRFHCIRRLMGGASCYGDNRGRVKPAVTVSNVTMATLKSYFSVHNEQFFNMIGKQYHDWRNV